MRNFVFGFVAGAIVLAVALQPAETKTAPPDVVAQGARGGCPGNLDNNNVVDVFDLFFC